MPDQPDLTQMTQAYAEAWQQQWRQLLQDPQWQSLWAQYAAQIPPAPAAGSSMPDMSQMMSQFAQNFGMSDLNASPATPAAADAGAGLRSLGARCERLAVELAELRQRVATLEQQLSDPRQ